MRIIPRRIDVLKIKNSLPWVMIYGRRKTGKTFLVENFLKYDNFYFVNRDGSILNKKTGEIYFFDEFIAILREILGSKRIVIDEFHRLSERFLDFLHSQGIKGELILITSTLSLSKKLLEKKQPLLGIVKPVRIDLVDEREILGEMSKKLRGKELIESATYLREVILLPYFKGNIKEFLINYLEGGKIIIKELIGEIFSEEEKELTNIYENVIKCIADRKNTSTEISNILFSKGLISKNNPGILQKYLGLLTEMGILEKIEVFGKKRKFRYFHKSPLIDLHYYLESKYFYTEVETPKKFIRKVVDDKIPQHVEQFFRNLFSKIYGMQHKIIEGKDFEIDIALFEFKKLKVVAEVKWRDFISKKEIKKIERNLSKFNAEKILIVPRKKNLEILPKGIKIMDVNDILKKLKTNYNGCYS